MAVPALERLMSIARKNLWACQQKNKMIVDYTIYFDIYDIGKKYELSLSNEELCEVKNNTNESIPYLVLKLTQNTMLEWLLGCEDFNMLDSGHRINFYRKPNDLINEAYYLLCLFRV